ncbi:gypsy retrotransposon integrase-like protein 1 [Plakobranchus ocellatus]|uniref:Gypsy retrotransposon integrase-like protein 1 n=1 Tax=Plakobranchus ocellatus TaxID=259542 RepID=A0AAV3ZTG9_9GAST|nr:gypsy retrotransposon integrase-like protein 1 [Plakobranchus ocellatus]
MHILRELWTKEIEEPEVKSSYEYVLNLRERLDVTLKIAREELEKAQGRQKRYYDRTAKRRKFSVGEKVLVLLPTDSNKLLMQWKRPFEIVTTVGINDYRINIDRPGTASREEHCIELTSSIPVRQRSYPVPYAMRQRIRDELREMEDLGVIRKISSPYASPVVVVKKKDDRILEVILCTQLFVLEQCLERVAWICNVSMPSCTPLKLDAFFNHPIRSDFVTTQAGSTDRWDFGWDRHFDFITRTVQSLNGPGARAQTCTQAGWFGNKCEFQCHCANNAGCDRTTGACNNGCDPQWFGPACQYAVLKLTISGGSGSNLFSLPLALDNDDRTCVLRGPNSITVKLETPQPLTWIRVVSNTAFIPQFQLLYKGESSTSFTTCANPRFAKVDDSTLDISCPTSNSIAEFTLSGLSVWRICSIYINGGRNVALKQTAEQSSTFDGWVSSNAVDGDPGVPDDDSKQRSTCSHTLGNSDTSHSWEVTFSLAVEIHSFKIYNRKNPSTMGCCEVRLVNFTLQALSSSRANSTYSYTDPGGPAQDIYTVIPSPRIGFAVNSVKIDTSRNVLGYLTLCEVLVFGEVVCPPVKFGRQCEHDCNCFDQTEACFVSTGGCPSGCAAGYSGEDCYTQCNPGRYGKNCRETCSDQCAGDSPKSCNHVNGTCDLGCVDGYYGPLCDDECPRGKYGSSCEKNCSVHCAGRYNTCDWTDGSCHQGCDPGYLSPLCTEGEM